MKTEKYTNIPNTFGEVQIGECFTTETLFGGIFFKIEPISDPEFGMINTISLDTGEYFRYEDTDPVFAVEAKVLYEIKISQDSLEKRDIEEEI